MKSDLWSRSAVDLAAMIRAREVSCVEVTESALGNASPHTTGASTPSSSECSEEALREAERRDRDV